ncbi:hypothetical protein L1279_000510 [Planomicrobium sp. HSC-17F08]|nr:hypothetical protein [Planomicrobium sp. HSC-17F08]
MVRPIKNPRYEQAAVSIDEMVPQDYFLRTVDALIDFSFVETIALLYCCLDNGPQAIPPSCYLRCCLSVISMVLVSSANCPLRRDCFSMKSKQRSISRHIRENEKEKVRANKRSSSEKTVQVTKPVHRTEFADAKELHSFRYARRRAQVYPRIGLPNSRSTEYQKMTLLLSRRV